MSKFAYVMTALDKQVADEVARQVTPDVWRCVAREMRPFRSMLTTAPGAIGAIGRTVGGMLWGIDG